jgi:hypothetical protein
MNTQHWWNDTERKPLYSGDKSAAGCIDIGWAHGKQGENADNMLVHIGFKGMLRHGWEGKITICLTAVRCEGSDASGN